MGCFVAPVTEAIVVTAAAFIVKHKEKKNADKMQSMAKEEKKDTISTRLLRLSKLLFGGGILLIFEHIWHGEVIPYFPFFTRATEGSEAVNEMLYEISTTGILMAFLCTLVWGVIEIIRYKLDKKNEKEVALE